ncbi:MAG: protein kinase [Polyangiaceae bacterium]
MSSDPFGLVGSVLDGQFRVERVVGEGGFSVVYRGLHVGLGEPIAIKCLKLPPSLGSALVDSFVRRFRDESRLQYRLSQGSLYIVRSIASGTTTAPATSALVPYTVLEWLDGKSLATDFEDRRAAGYHGRPLADVVKLMDTAIDAVAFAHSQGVVHRDLNPGNFFLATTREGIKLKVLDFGVAKVVNDHALEMGPRVETIGQIRIFSPAYGSPEQFDPNVGQVGPWSDVYSLALVAVECLTDRTVMDGDHLGEFAAKALDPNRPTPRRLGIAVGDGVEEVFARALALSPSDRPADAGELWGRLKNAMQRDAASGDAPSADPSRAFGASGHPASEGAITIVSVPAKKDVSSPTMVTPPSSEPSLAPSSSVTKHASTTTPTHAGIQPPRGLGGTLALSERPKIPGLDAPLPEANAPAATPPATPDPGYGPRGTVAFGQRPPIPGEPGFVPPTSPSPGTPAGYAAQAPSTPPAIAYAPSSLGSAPVSGPTSMRVSAPPEIPKKSSAALIFFVVGFVVVGALAFGATRLFGGSSETKTDAGLVATPTPAIPPMPVPVPVPVPDPMLPPTSAVASNPSPPTPPGTIVATPAPNGSTATPSPNPNPGATAIVPDPKPIPSNLFPPATPSPPSVPASPVKTKSFDATNAKSSLDVMNGILASCRRTGGVTGQGHVWVTFGNDGAPTNVVVDQPPFAGTPDGDCVAARFRRAKMAPFEGPVGTVSYTFTVPR